MNANENENSDIMNVKVRKNGKKNRIVAAVELGKASMSLCV